MATVIPTIRTMPSKIFFVDMLTRDLTLADAILDLVDNSIDKLIKRFGLDATKSVITDHKHTPIDGAKIVVLCEPDRFIIADTSGGMTRQDIENRVFVLGNPKSLADSPGLSVYGIGMKRAFFKIGSYIELLTSSEEDGSHAVIWDIEEWKDQEEWELAFAEPSMLNIDRGQQSYGTTIQITNLYREIHDAFNRQSFRNDLVKRLESVYAGFIAAGVSLSLQTMIENKSYTDDIESVLPKLGTSEDINYAHHSFTYETVSVDMYAGITPWEDKIPRGWYVFCNGRMVVSANKDWLTGWGDNHPGFHPKYNHFVGFVFFSSDDLLDLPWPTTKQGIIREARVYQLALEEMKLLSRPILNFFDVRLSRDEIVEADIERNVLSFVSPTPLYTQSQSTFRYTSKAPEGPPMVSINYKKTADEVRRAKVAFGETNMSNKSVGERTFDYYLENEE